MRELEVKKFDFFETKRKKGIKHLDRVISEEENVAFVKKKLTNGIKDLEIFVVLQVNVEGQPSKPLLQM